MIRQRWATLAVLLCMTASEGMAGMLTPPYLKSLGLPLSVIGVVIGIYAWMTLLSRLPSGLLYRPRWARPLVALALLGQFGAALLYPRTDDVLLLCGIRLLHGLSYGVASTINLALYMDGGIADRQRAMTWYTFAVTVGFLVGNFVGGVFGDQLGYPSAYTVSGALALVAIVLLFWERPRAGTSPGGSPPVSRPVPARGLPLGGPLVAALADPKIASVALVAFAIAFYFQLGAAFFPLYGISVGLSLTELGLIRSSQSLAMVVFTPLATWPMRWWGHRKASYFALMAQCGVLMLVPAFQQFPPLLPLFSANGAVRGIMNTANAVSLAEDVDECRVSRGMASSIFNAGKDLGNISGPFIAGFIASAIGLSALFVVVPPLTMVVVLSVVAALVLKERRRLARLAIEPQA